jgi:DNA-directed RNA polymerase alpha subunit
MANQFIIPKHSVSEIHTYRTALALTGGADISDSTAELILIVSKAVQDLGSSFSIQDSTRIMDYISQKYDKNSTEETDEVPAKVEETPVITVESKTRISEIPGLSTRAIKILYNYGVYNLGDLRTVKKSELRRIRNCGLATIDNIYRALINNGVSTKSFES